MFKSKTSCSAFLSNYDTNNPARVMFRGFPYDLPSWSISILPDCKTEYHNTAKVNKLISFYQNTINLIMTVFWDVQTHELGKANPEILMVIGILTRILKKYILTNLSTYIYANFFLNFGVKCKYFICLWLVLTLGNVPIQNRFTMKNHMSLYVHSGS